MKKGLICILSFLFVISSWFLNIPKISAQPMELKAISFLPKGDPITEMIPVWIERVNTELKGTLKINWVGGPEVMPPFNQPEAVRTGVFPLGCIPAAYYSGILPEGDAICLSKFDFKKEREKGGVWDYFVERHKKINMMPLGTWLYEPFYLYMKKPVSKLEDLKGLKMRTAAKYDKLLVKLGMIPITIQIGETYTGLQRGVVEGFGITTRGPRIWGWLESIKYVLDIPFYVRQNTFFLVNLDVWNKLSKDVQDKLIDITIKFEPDMKAYFEKEIEKEKGEMEKIGVKRFKLSPEDSKKFLDTANDAMWEDLEKKVPGEVKILKKLMAYN